MSSETIADNGQQSATEKDATEIFLRCTYLSELMSTCIVEDKYKPPVPLVMSIALSQRGKSLAGHAKGNGVALHEAQLAAFLEGTAGDDLLFDPRETNLAALVDNLSHEIKRRKIQYPWIFGRKLYDLVVESTFHGDRDPSHEETIGLLEQLPQGVFQNGPYVVGPYGIFESEQWRILAPAVSVPGYHCDEIDCDRVHAIRLATGENGVTKARASIKRKKAALHSRSSEFIDQVAKFEAQRIPPYSWTRSTGLAPFIFECLTASERQDLMIEVLNLNGFLRHECARVGVSVKDAREFTSTLGDAEYLQILLLAIDSDIHSCLNRLIWNKKILIRDGEIRACHIVRQGFGPLDVRLEASTLGVRYRPATSLLQVRLREIFSACFPQQDGGQQDHLKWILREQEGDTPAARLTNAMSAEQPSALVGKLLASNEASYRHALAELALPSQEFETTSDDDIARLISWHVGFVGSDQSIEMHDLRENLTALKNVIRGIPVGNLGRAEASQVRQLSSDVFVGLEEFLKTTIAFAVWSMLNDHYTDSRGLSYTPDTAYKFFSTWLSGRSTDLGEKELAKFTLGDLLEAFGLLSKHFGELELNNKSLQREASGWPKSSRISGSPFLFPFKSIHPFLDLDNPSRKHIRSLVQSVPASFGEFAVLEVRNGLLHHTAELPDRNKIGGALDAVEARVLELANNGLYPLVFVMASSHSDAYGRKTVTLRSGEDQEVLLVRPSALDLSGFPALSRRQSIVVAARLADIGEPLRFLWNVDSSYGEYWKDFPRRPPLRNSLHRQASSEAR